MKILMVITRAELGGAQRHVMDLIQGLIAAHEIHLAAGEDGWLIQEAGSLGVVCHLVSAMAREVSIADDLCALRGLSRLMGDLQPDLVHVHSSKAGVLGRLAAYRHRLPVVYTAHGWGFKPGVPWRRRGGVWAVEKAMAGLTDQIICVSNYDLNLACRNWVASPSQLSVVHNAAGPSPLPETSFGATPDELKVVMVARFQEPKQQPLLIAAFQEMDLPQPASLWLVGDGPLMEEARAAVRDDRAPVRFLGARKDVPEILSECQVFVLLSGYEGLPISILEAMSAGLPVIASAVGGVPELVEHGVTGYLIPPGETKALGTTLGQLIADPGLRRRLGDAGRRAWQERFTLEHMVKKTEAIYQKATHRRAMHPG